MTGALPMLKVSTIPGSGPVPEPPPTDLIGDLLTAPSSNPELPAGPRAPQAPAQPAGKPQTTPEFF